MRYDPIKQIFGWAVAQPSHSAVPQPRVDVAAPRDKTNLLIG